MINATSVKDRLKNQATASGRAFQELLLSYGLERTVYRLSMSEYKERFTLKGAFSSMLYLTVSLPEPLETSIFWQRICRIMWKI